MGTGSPWTELDTSRLTELHGRGLSLTAAARQMERSSSAVSNHARRLGLSWRPAPHTRAATEAHRERANRRRAELQAAGLDAAARHLGQMFSPVRIHNFSKDNDLAWVDLPEPTHTDKRAIAASFNSLIAATTRLAEYERESGGGSEVVVSMLGRVAAALWSAGPDNPETPTSQGETP